MTQSRDYPEGLFALNDRPGEDCAAENPEAFDRIGHRAVWSDDTRHRFILWRDWGPRCLENFVQFIGLNPSTANETENDPTLRRVIGFAKGLGAAGVVMTNIFSLRSTNPRALYDCTDHRLADNDSFLRDVAKFARVTICAWGCHGGLLRRGEQVAEMLRDDGRRLWCYGKTGNGQPKHPLYLPADSLLRDLATGEPMITIAKPSRAFELEE